MPCCHRRGQRSAVWGGALHMGPAQAARLPAWDRGQDTCRETQTTKQKTDFFFLFSNFVNWFRTIDFPKQKGSLTFLNPSITLHRIQTGSPCAECSQKACFAWPLECWKNMNQLRMFTNLSISCKIPDCYLVLKKQKIWQNKPIAGCPQSKWLSLPWTQLRLAPACVVSYLFCPSRHLHLHSSVCLGTAIVILKISSWNSIKNVLSSKK